MKLKTLATIAMASAIGLASCSSKLYSGTIDGKQVEYTTCNLAACLHPHDKMSIHDERTKTTTEIRDFGRDEVIGNDDEESLIITQETGEGTRKVTYNINYVEEELNGDTIAEYYSNDSLSVKAREISKVKLQEATTLYQRYKREMERQLEERLK